MLYLMSSINDAKVSDLLHANRLLLRMKSDQVNIKLFDTGNIEDMKLAAYNDASYANLQDGASQGGFIIFLTNKNECKASATALKSRKLKSIMKSRLAAETLSQKEASEACLWLGSNVSEVLYGSLDNIPFTECKTDNHSLVDAVYSSKAILDRRLRVDIATIRQMVERKALKKITWIDKSRKVADCLTEKGGVSLQAFESAWRG